MTKKDAARSTFPRRRPRPSPGFSRRPMPAPTASSDTAPASRDRYRAQPAQGVGDRRTRPDDLAALAPLLEREAHAGRPTFVVTRACIATAASRGRSSAGRVRRRRDAVRAPRRCRGARGRAPRRARLRLHPGARHPRTRLRLGVRRSGCRTGGARRGPSPVRRSLAPGVGALVTADHGMVDVPAIGTCCCGTAIRCSTMCAGGGEPRMLQLYTEDGERAPSRRAGVKPSSRARG
jgi:hypothetical protein